MEFILSLVSLFLAGMCKGVMDTLQFHFSVSIFKNRKAQFWNPQESWRNKYKDGDPTKGPKFPGSTTIFVALTDGWHLFQLFMLACIRTAIVLPASARLDLSANPKLNLLYWFLVWVALIPVFSGGFYLMYYRWLNAKTDG